MKAGDKEEKQGMTMKNWVKRRSKDEADIKMRISYTTKKNKEAEENEEAEEKE